MFLLKSTKLRRKLLAFSFNHVDESHYVRELAGQIGEDPGNLSRELKRLEEEGVYRSRLKGNLKLYGLNREYHLFEELKKMMAKTERIEDHLERLFSGIGTVKKAFIAGPYVIGGEKKMTEVRLFVVGDITEAELKGHVQATERTFDCGINCTVCTEEEFAHTKVIKLQSKSMS